MKNNKGEYKEKKHLSVFHYMFYVIQLFLMTQIFLNENIKYFLSNNQIFKL